MLPIVAAAVVFAVDAAAAAADAALGFGRGIAESIHIYLQNSTPPILDERQVVREVGIVDKTWWGSYVLTRVKDHSHVYVALVQLTGCIQGRMTSGDFAVRCYSRYCTSVNNSRASHQYGREFLAPVSVEPSSQGLVRDQALERVLQ